MKTMNIPRALHEVFGERQRPLDMIASFLVGSLVPVFFVLSDAFPNGLAPWRLLIALLLIFDIAAGVVANFTRGTNDHYKESSRRRIVFIAIHWHLVAMFAALGYGLVPAFAITAYTLVAAFCVNMAYGKEGQAVLAGALVAVGIAGVSALGLTPLASTLSILFLVKLVLSFAVDHYPIPPQERAGEEA